MKVYAYVSSVTDEAPEAHRCIARIRHADGSWHPILFTGPTKQAVRDKANAWWDAEVEATKRKHNLTEDRIAAMKAARAAAAAKKEAAA